MSTDFIALFDVTVEEATPEWLLARVEEKADVFAPFVEKYGRFFRPEKWAVGAGHRGPEVVGPGGFALQVVGRTLELWHGIRFDLFTGDAWHRDTLRRICFACAGLVGSHRAIYTHELMPYAGDDGLVKIESGLRTRIGPPAKTFEELHAAEYFGPRAWYIDAFADLRRDG
jgi:hypothetical protein